MLEPGPIGVFDSGYGGLTVMKEVVKLLPQYDYIYLGDNARAPYGTRSFDTVYQYTLESVEYLFSRGCNLIILACNTASAKALRTIQQIDLPQINADKRVLGVIRPTTELIGEFTLSNTVGILGTLGTVQSMSYPIEIKKFFPEISVVQEACPMWVPLIENNEFENEGADFFIKKHIDAILLQNKSIDTLVLACTHYPLMLERIKKFVPNNIKILSQGNLVANALKKYLDAHIDLEAACAKNGNKLFLTTESIDSTTAKNQSFTKKASHFYGERIIAEHVNFHPKQK